MQSPIAEASIKDLEKISKKKKWNKKYKTNALKIGYKTSNFSRAQVKSNRLYAYQQIITALCQFVCVYTYIAFF